jgi:hypothetical protein
MVVVQDGVVGWMANCAEPAHDSVAVHLDGPVCGCLGQPCMDEMECLCLCSILDGCAQKN